MARDQVLPLTCRSAPDKACNRNICTRRPPSLKTLAFHAQFTLVRNIEQFRPTRQVTYSQYRASCTSKASILSSYSLLNFLPSHSCKLPRPVRAVLPTLYVPPVEHSFAPRHVGSSLARKRSRLCAQTETFIGVVSVTSRCFLKWIAHFTGKRETMYRSCIQN